MPIFEYEGLCGHRWEVIEKKAVKSRTKKFCPVCSRFEKVQLIISAPAKRAGYHGIQR